MTNGSDLQFKLPILAQFKVPQEPAQRESRVEWSGIREIQSGALFEVLPRGPWPRRRKEGDGEGTEIARAGLII